MRQEGLHLCFLFTIGVFHHDAGDGLGKEGLQQEIGKDKCDANRDEHGKTVSPKGLLNKW